MNIGIIGYGSMGKMLAQKFASSGYSEIQNVFVANRSKEKLASVQDELCICNSNAELAEKSDIIFVCVRPADIKPVINEIKDSVKEDALLVSLNGSVTFEMLEKLLQHKIAKVIPSVTAEINRSQTLVSYNNLVLSKDKTNLEKILSCMGNVVVLPENEIGMGSELVSCMPGFIASMFDVVCKAAKKHTSLPDEQIIKMVLNTVSATGDLMIQKGLSFEEVVARVATKGGITEEGSKIIYGQFPSTADAMFQKTLDKRKQTAENAAKAFSAGE
ncbi:MAG: NAD(P)-binding domain-containing protein [Treponema sp.]|nr:NAD(P)-binding domain-containing protein [Treponema sp.]